MAGLVIPEGQEDLVHYHVRIWVRGESRPEVELDLDEDVLQRRILRPYRYGEPLLINGRVIRSEDLERLRISQSVEPAQEILERIQLENDDQGISVFDHSRLNAQAAERADDVTDLLLKKAPPSADRRRVLLVQGRWKPAVQAMRDFLYALDLDVRDWGTARLSGQEGQHNTDILDDAFSECYAVVVFMTPDDAATLHPALTKFPDETLRLEGQPRPNVLFEAGYAWHAMRERTLLVEFGGELRKLSNLSGVDRVRFDGSARSRAEVAERLKSIGLAVRTEGRNYLEAGLFPTPLPGVTVADLGRSPASDLLEGVPLQWVLLAALAGGRSVDIDTTAAHMGVAREAVVRTLSWLMAQGLALPVAGHSRSQAARNGACRISGEGVERLHAEKGLPQG
ncbi:TIR domain-containing protein [Streptomyces sp. FR-108]|uniref:TIR domain-containing protein n=1 Tax=Streptomyces sp. FR-108 TaxID=3416665 RepID=UPI003CF3130F